MSTLNCSSIYNIMPYWQYKRLQQEENCEKIPEKSAYLSLDTDVGVRQRQINQQTTGITPMIEKNISFSNNQHENSVESLNADMLKGASNESTLAKEDFVHDKNASNGKKVGIKRAASPTPVEIKKRTKSAEEKASAVFKESSDWE